MTRGGRVRQLDSFWCDLSRASDRECVPNALTIITNIDHQSIAFGSPDMSIWQSLMMGWRSHLSQAANAISTAFSPFNHPFRVQIRSNFAACSN
ncbi:MAG: hypothetical protein SWY16_15270 [Cyanobacteriota bacterium]|nr:hypothetical protein [Cyanobacteriota bacterium]